MEEIESIITRQTAHKIHNKMFGELKGATRLREAIAAFAEVEECNVHYFGYSWSIFFNSEEQRNEFNKKIVALKND